MWGAASCLKDYMIKMFFIKKDHIIILHIMKDVFMKSRQKNIEIKRCIFPCIRILFLT